MPLLSRRNRLASSPRPVTATRRRSLQGSAAVLNIGDKSQAIKVARSRQAWQSEAWMYRRALPECRYAVAYIGNSCLRMKLFPGTFVGDHETPVPVGSEEAADLPQDLVDAAHEAMEALKSGGPLALPMLFKRLSEQFEVAGEALDVDTRVATPTGFARMGDLVAGDWVLGGDGQPCRVTVAHPIRHDRPCYEVKLSGDVSVVADAEHLWVTHRRNARQTLRNRQTRTGVECVPDPETTGRLVTTEEMADTLYCSGASGTAMNHAIELTTVMGADPGIDGESYIDPYVLGYWLGDGTSVSGAITVHTDDQPHLREQIEAAGYGWSPRSSHGGYYIGILGLQKQLRLLGLINNKHIPAAYLRHTEAARWALLQGLIDSDGHVDHEGRVEFSNINKRLLWEVTELAASLGLRPGRVGEHRIVFNSAGMPVARLPRKAERIAPKKERDYWRYVQSVDQVKSRPVRCITVDSPDQTFLVTEYFVRTHNCYLVGETDPITGILNWSIRSVNEIFIKGEKYGIRETPSESMSGGSVTGVRWLPEGTYISRLWWPDPEFAYLADSPFQAIREQCEELMLLSKEVRALARSRLANSGLLLLSDELSVVTAGRQGGDVEGGDGDDDDPFFREFVDSAVTALTNEGSASSVVPIIARGPAGAIQNGVRFMALQRPMTQQNAAARVEVIGRMATGLDLPNEVLLGKADLNHWASWQISDDTFKHHIEPIVIVMCDALTAGYLWPMLDAQNKWDPALVRQVLCWYDPTELVTHPDRSQDAFQAWDRLAISDKALRNYLGFPDDDAPLPQEILIRLSTHVRSLDPALQTAILKLLDPKLDLPMPEQGGTVAADPVPTGGGDAGPPAPAGAPIGSDTNPGPPSTGGTNGNAPTPDTVSASVDGRLELAAGPFAPSGAGPLAPSGVGPFAPEQFQAEREPESAVLSEAQREMVRATIAAIAARNNEPVHS